MRLVLNLLVTYGHTLIHQHVHLRGHELVHHAMVMMMTGGSRQTRQYRALAQKCIMDALTS